MVKHFAPESKEQLKLKTEREEPSSVFLDERWIIFIDYLKKETNNPRRVLCELIAAFEWWEKKTIFEKKKSLVLFHQENVPVHKSLIAMGKINELNFVFLLCASYSPDLALLDNLLFSTFGGKRFCYS